MKICIKKDYSEARKSAYPSIEEQLDILYHQGMDAWKQIITEIKDQHPKPDGAE